MEVSALKYSAGMGLHGRMSLLRLQSDERLIAFIRRGNGGAFEALVARYETRLLAFCRHLLGSREDAEDVLQEVLSAAFNAIVADERPINVRPWLYRIARNRSLNHLRKIRTIGVDSMDAHFSDNGASTADKVHERDAFRMLVGDIHELPETQKTALVLREMDALSYEQIAEAMETTVPSVKSLLVRARVSLAEAAEARLLSCEEVRIELGEIAEGLRRRPTPLVRRHLRACKRCATFRTELKRTNKALAALMPVGPLLILKKLAIVHLGHSAGSGAGAAGAGSGATAAGSGVAAVGSGAAGASAAGSFAVAGSTGGFVSAGMGVIAAKAAAGLAAAAIVTASAVGIDHSAHRRVHHQAVAAASAPAAPAALKTAPATTRIHVQPTTAVKVSRRHETKSATKATFVAATVPAKAAPPAAPAKPTTTTLAGRTSKQSDPTVLPPAASTPPAPPPLTAPAPSTTGSAPPADDPTSTSQASTPPPASTTPTGPAPTSGTSPTPTGPTPPPSGGGSGGSGGTDPGSGTGGGTDPGGTPPEPPAPPSGAPPAVAP
jgi:RNA polymerase sigma factor (sigma-70 family)